MPILDDVLHKPSHSTVFTKLDLKLGYWHVTLDEESSYLTTFQTCFGRYRYPRLPFGLNVSAEIFQKKVLQVFGDMDGVIVVVDDLIVDGATKEEHDHNLRAVLQKCQEFGIKLNANKMDLAQGTIRFMGHIITKDGIRVDPDKIKAIDTYPVPKNLEQLRRFLGMVNYLARYMPSLRKVLHPLRNLVKKDTPFVWSESQEAAFQYIKQLVATSPILSYYDTKKELLVENDASEYGLGSTLLQEGKPIAFASRTFSQSERNYAQIEKELLAVVFGLQKFHHYTYDRKVTVVTDHKPLVAISCKPLHRAPRRLQALLLKTQTYDYDMMHMPGTQIPISDAFSRPPTKDEEAQLLEEVCNLSLIDVPHQRLNEIRGATQKDETLKCLMDTISNGWPEDKNQVHACLLPYFPFRDELTVQDGIILRGERVVIPHSLRLDMKMKVHSGHPGINASLRRARERIYWPGMSKDIRNYVETCDTCATYGTKQAAQALQMHEVPSRPWEKVGADLLSFKGRQYLIKVDYYSQFFELDHIPETTSRKVIYKLKHHFSRHDIPDTLISDNGPQFSSADFKNFARTWSFKHDPISPGNSKANGAAEASVKIAKSTMMKCQRSREDPFLAFLNMRNTPTEGTTPCNVSLVGVPKHFFRPQLRRSNQAGSTQKGQSWKTKSSKLHRNSPQGRIYQDWP